MKRTYYSRMFASMRFSSFSFYFRSIYIGCSLFFSCSWLIFFGVCVDVVAGAVVLCVYLFSAVCFVFAYIWGSAIFSLCLFTLSSIFMQDGEPHSDMHISFALQAACEWENKTKTQRAEEWEWEGSWSNNFSNWNDLTQRGREFDHKLCATVGWFGAYIYTTLSKAFRIWNLQC